MWAGRLGWPPHPCPCRPHCCTPPVQTDHRSRSCSLIACAEPFDDSAWLSNSSSPSLSAGEWDKPPLPAHSPIFLSNLPLLRHVYVLPSRREHCPGHGRTRVGVEEAIIPQPLLSRSAGTSEPASTQAATTNINPNATMNAMRIQASPTLCSGCGKRATASFELAGGHDRAGRRAANLLI